MALTVVQVFFLKSVVQGVRILRNLSVCACQKQLELESVGQLLSRRCRKIDGDRSLPILEWCANVVFSGAFFARL